MITYYVNSMPHQIGIVGFMIYVTLVEPLEFSFGMKDEVHTLWTVILAPCHA